jgi:hypothetical protein
MGNLINVCEEKDIGGEITIEINKEQNQNMKDKEHKFQIFINSLRKFYIIHIFNILKNYEKEVEDNSNIIKSNNNNHLLYKNQADNIQSNADNLTLNSGAYEKDVDDTQIIDNNKNNNNIHIQNPSNIKKNETPDGDIISQQISDSPPEVEHPKLSDNQIIKPIPPRKKIKPPGTRLTPIPEYTFSTNFDKSLMPGDLILNFNDIPQIDKITEIENNIGGEFIIEQKELLKIMEEYPFLPKFFSIRYPTGEKYSGYYSPDWIKEVFGIQIDKNGSKYVGMFKNGMFDGRGRLILHKGDYYEGEFVQNKANGLGKYVNAKGEIYNGSWVNDKQEGEGELILKDGSIYQGEFKNGKKNGKGRITWIDNSYYEGDFVNNYYEGYGAYIMINKRKGYLGEWKEGKMHGFGVFFWADGRSYKGYYESDKKHGYGIYSGKNNLRYEGKFKKGKQYGIGRIINEKGEKQLGLYLKGKKLKYLDESEFKDDIKKLDEEIEKINHMFNNHEFFVKNKDLMNITLDQT